MYKFDPAPLKKIIESRGIKHTVLSKKVGTSSTVVYDIIERGKIPKIDTLMRISQEIEVSIYEILGMPDPAQLPAEQKVHAIKDLVQALEKEASDDDVLRPITESMAKVLEERKKK